MINLSTTVKAILPGRVRNVLRSAHRRYVFAMAMRRFLQKPSEALMPGSSILDDLIYGWANEAWSAKSEYLKACIDHAINVQGPILECGSGLSTLLIGAAVKPIGKKSWALEHEPEWAEVVEKYAKKYGLTNIKVLSCALSDYGSFDWYMVPLNIMPREFGLVICDGPPGSTKGGRFGLLPVMSSNLSSSCRILLDDADRNEEVQIANRWCDEFDLTIESCSTAKTYLLLTRAGNGRGTA